jgi:tetratricopeptide (TPR) repeat protein
MSKISAALIVKGWDEHLDFCLKSIKKIVDEIVILDCSGSGRVRESAGTFATVHPYTWEDDFSAARNRSISLSSKEIIFVIDADEAVSEKDAAAFEKIRGLDATTPWGISLATRNYFNTDILDLGYRRTRGDYPEMESSASGYVVSEKVRVFPKLAGIGFENRIHETAEKSILRQRGKIIPWGEPVIHHFGYLAESGSPGKKQMQYGALLQKETAEKPHSFKALYDLAYHLFLAEQWDESRALFLKAQALGRHDMVSFYLGVIALRQKQPAEALSFFSAVSDRSNPVLAYHTAQAHCDMGDFGKAVPLLRQALRDMPDSIPVLQSLVQAYLEDGQTKQAKYYLDKIKKNKNSDNRHQSKT